MYHYLSVWYPKWKTNCMEGLPLYLKSTCLLRTNTYKRSKITNSLRYILFCICYIDCTITNILIVKFSQILYRSWIFLNAKLILGLKDFVSVCLNQGAAQNYRHQIFLLKILIYQNGGMVLDSYTFYIMQRQYWKDCCKQYCLYFTFV